MRNLWENKELLRITCVYYLVILLVFAISCFVKKIEFKNSELGGVERGIGSNGLKHCCRLNKRLLLCENLNLYHLSKVMGCVCVSVINGIGEGQIVPNLVEKFAEHFLERFVIQHTDIIS